MWSLLRKQNVVNVIRMHLLTSFFGILIIQLKSFQKVGLLYCNSPTFWNDFTCNSIIGCTVPNVFFKVHYTPLLAELGRS